MKTLIEYDVTPAELLNLGASGWPLGRLMEVLVEEWVGSDATRMNVRIGTVKAIEVGDRLELHFTFRHTGEVLRWLRGESSRKVLPSVEVLAQWFSEAADRGVRVERVWLHPNDWSSLCSKRHDYLEIETQESLLRLGVVGYVFGVQIRRDRKIPQGQCYLTMEKEAPLDLELGWEPEFSRLKGF